MVNTEEIKMMAQLSAKMMSLLERLAEMFPDSNYQSRLEQYINSKHPTNAADVEYWTMQYHYHKVQQ
jgi:ArsR family metal-binding transcriptional regulator